MIQEDNRKLYHKSPCDDCPFKVRSLPGYLGGYRLEPYRSPPSVGMPTTCHKRDYGADEPESALCAGACAVIANDPNIQPLADYADAVKSVGKREDCFPSIEAFSEHHKNADRFASKRS